MKKCICPNCGKELVRLEPFEVGVYKFWCDDCNIDICIEKEEEEKMKKYELKDYKKFCEEALIMPPFEDDEQIDEWFETHKVHIIANDCVMELDYDADVINEIEFGLREIHEALLGSGEATTGNTVGSEYRPATLKDVVRAAVCNDWEEWGYHMIDFDKFLREFARRFDGITSVFEAYDEIYKNIKGYTEQFKCDFGKLDMHSLRLIDSDSAKKAIMDLVATDIEFLVGYDKDGRCSDITYIMDYSLKPSGELIGWFYGEEDAEYTAELIENYKNKLFGEEN